MASKVYFGSPRQARLEAEETLPAKLDRILNELHLRDRVKDETVVIKIHSGTNIGYSTIHPLFIRKVVQAVKDGGGHPFITDVDWDVNGAETRGYTSEVLGCPIYPSAGLKDHYHYDHKRPFKSIETWQVAGMIEDASFLVNFAHVKGHPSCGFGGVMKNLALGCLTGESRSKMHDVMHFDQYWFPERCTDRQTFECILASCPHQALVEDKHHPGNIHLHFEQCNQCGRCLKVAPEGSLKIDAANFHAFQEALATSVAVSLSTFAPEKRVHMALANQMTPVCDCFGFTGMPILPDAGIFGSDDIIAVETAILDKIAETKLIEENIPTSMEVHTREGHPFRWLHGPLKDPYLVTEYGEKLGLGSRQYELVDVYPVETVLRAGMAYISAK
jgi:uncharacterized Fe-S center protein